jgi:hypothetical protein
LYLIPEIVAKNIKKWFCNAQKRAYTYLIFQIERLCLVGMFIEIVRDKAEARAPTVGGVAASALQFEAEVK